MQKITTCLWFDNQAEEAVNFYTSVFKDSKIGKTARYGKNMPGPEGAVMTVEFELEGRKFLALNGGPVFKFNEAISLVINCKDQAEIDHYWNKLSEGGIIQECGWLKDKYGLSWQVVPDNIDELMASKDPEASLRAMQALMKMKKLDIKALQRAYDGEAVTA